MSMSRKNYEDIAHVLNNVVIETDQRFRDGDMSEDEYAQASYTFSEIAQNLAVVFEGDNPNFDPNRFLKACGVEV